MTALSPTAGKNIKATGSQVDLTALIRIMQWL